MTHALGAKARNEATGARELARFRAGLATFDILTAIGIRGALRTLGFTS